MLGSVRQIESAGAHLLALVNDMLDLSSLDAGRLNLVLEPVALGPLVERCIALVGPHAQQHGIIFESGSAASVPTVLADVRAVGSCCSTCSAMPSSSPTRTPRSGCSSITTRPQAGSRWR